jgi:hypothetical protein
MGRQRAQLTIVCEPCVIRGRYAVTGLLEEHGDAKLTDLLRRLTDCPKTRSAGIHDRCKAAFEGLRARQRCSGDRRLEARTIRRGF